MNAFPSVRIEGGLFSSEILEKILNGELPGQDPRDFGLKSRVDMTNEMASAFSDAKAYWGVFKKRLDKVEESKPATSETREYWVIPFLSLLGYELQSNSRAYEVDGLTFDISHRAGQNADAPPVHIVGARQDLGRLPASGRPRLAPHSLVQEFLNRTEHLWGLVTNGRVIRLLRDSTYIRRQAYVEFNIESIMEEERFQDFVALYRLIHRTRLPINTDEGPNSFLEQYYQYSLIQGSRFRENLRYGVEECLKRLANGFLKHPDNDDFRRRVVSSNLEVDGISAEELYRQLLRLIYRMLFLLVSEERGLISSDPIYRDHYSVSRLRRLVDKRRAYTDHEDIWRSLQVTWKALSNERFSWFLKMSPLNSELFAHIDFDDYLISNNEFAESFYYLVYYEENQTRLRRVNYAALDVEELGSVYESLLEYKPHIDNSGECPHFDLITGSERRTTGSYYTPPELVGELIHSALEPVIYERLKSAKSKAEKEKAILSIRVCDPAAGSGHFLLAASRRLGKELAKIRTGEDEPAPERVREAIRDVVSHCIYGVDKNPLAVELCKVALWLESHAEGKPLTFLDHKIRCGDSLVGISTLETLNEGIPDKAFMPITSDDKIASRNARRQNALERQSSLYHGTFNETLKRLADTLYQIESLSEDTMEQIREKADTLHRIEQSNEFQRLNLACDAWTSAFFQSYNNRDHLRVTTGTLHSILSEGGGTDAQLLGFIFKTSTQHNFFHWPLIFPEVFASGGFDVVLGNPPFMGGLKISGKLGDNYRKYLGAVFEPFGGTADLCAAFYRRVFSLLRKDGRIGMVATNTISEGDTRECGLKVILEQGGNITYAKRFIKWPGAANVEVNLISIYKSELSLPKINQTSILDGRIVDFISSRLDDEFNIEPKRLPQNKGRAFIGSYVLGLGFMLKPENAHHLLEKDPRNAECLFPYLNGEDLNSHPEQHPSRWVINFFDWDLEKACQYPDLISIVEQKVKPEREKLREEIPIQAKRKKFWWQYGSSATELYAAIAHLQQVAVRSRVSELHALVFVPKGYVYGDATVVFAFDDFYHFALLQSNVHEIWVRRNASSLESRNRYTPTDCFDTFPFPPEEYKNRRGRNIVVIEDLLEPFKSASKIGAAYHDHRKQIMLNRNIGLTEIYNYFNNPDCSENDIDILRKLHIEMDKTILACYGWDDIEPSHGFYQNPRGQTRFTVSPQARKEILKRLLDLNLRIASEGEM